MSALLNPLVLALLENMHHAHCLTDYLGGRMLPHQLRFVNNLNLHTMARHSNLMYKHKAPAYYHQSKYMLKANIEIQTPILLLPLIPQLQSH